MTAELRNKIDLLKIKSGEHKYDFEITDKFFEHFEGSILKQGSIKVQLTLEKTSNTYDARLTGQGTVKVACDRCLNLIDFPVKFDMGFIIKLVDSPMEDDDEIVYVTVGEGVFDVSQHIYDAIYLALPIRKICEDAGIAEGCDSTVIDKLDHLNGDEEHTPDPRWNKLKDLLE